jgi:lipopolysaccharide transport system permease protein
MLIQLLREQYNYRHLIWILAWVDFKQRYKNSVLGYFWSLLEPLMMLSILYLIFSNLMKSPVEYYPLFLLMGLIMWNFFSRATTSSLAVIRFKPSMIKKVYFPREILVISTCTTAFLMSLFESIVFIVFMAIFQIPLSLYILYLPCIIFLYYMLTLGVSLALAALNVFYQDVQYIWAVILQIGFFATPVMYPLSVFPPYLQHLLSYNPLAQIIFLARDVTLYAKAPNAASFAYVIVIAFVILATGYWIFSRMEPRFAEEL